MCKIRWLREEFEAAFMHSEHGNMGGVRWCIVVVKQHLNVLTYLGAFLTASSRVVGNGGR